MSPSTKATCNICSKVFRSKIGLNSHKRHCKAIPAQWDESLDLSDMMEEDFDVTSDSVGTSAKNDKQECKSDECKKSKETLRKRATTYSKKCALLTQEIQKLKRKTTKVNDNENTANEPSELEQILPNLPLKSDLENFGKDLFNKFIKYFETSNANIPGENGTNEPEELTGAETENTIVENEDETIPETENNVDRVVVENTVTEDNEVDTVPQAENHIGTTEMEIVDLSSETGEEHIIVQVLREKIVQMNL